MVNDSTDIIEKVEGKKPVRKLFVALAVIGAALGFAVASFFAFIKPLPEVSNAEYSSTLEVKSSGSHSASNVSSNTETVPAESEAEINADEDSKAEEITDCTAPEITDPDAFIMELKPCEFTIVTIDSKGNVVEVDPINGATQVIYDKSSVVSVVPNPRQTSGSSSGSKGSNNSSGSVDSSTPESAAPPAPAPAPAPVSNRCPQSRDENPGVYDACRAGFAAPSLEVTGVVGCSANNAEGTSYNVTLGFALSGGSYGRTAWMGVSSQNGGSATTQFSVSGLSPESLNQEMNLLIYGVTVDFYSMDGRYDGIIHRANYNGTAFGTLSACR